MYSGILKSHFRMLNIYMTAAKWHLICDFPSVNKKRPVSVYTDRSLFNLLHKVHY